jgi:hypothetical protein
MVLGVCLDSTNITFYPSLCDVGEPENNNCLQVLFLSCCYLQQYFGSIFSSTRVYPEFCAAARAPYSVASYIQLAYLTTFLSV